MESDLRTAKSGIRSDAPRTKSIMEEESDLHSRFYFTFSVRHISEYQPIVSAISPSSIFLTAYAFGRGPLIKSLALHRPSFF